MILATEYAIKLSDLTSDQFRIVATKDAGDRTWRWTIPDREVKAFQAAVTHRDIVSPQRRDSLGWVLLAKLAAVR